MTLSEVSPFAIGALIALFERAVGFYASMININAYHQPGVEAGKKAASKVILLKKLILHYLQSHPSQMHTADQLTIALGAAEATETIFKLCEHLAANNSAGIKKIPGDSLADHKYGILEVRDK